MFAAVAALGSAVSPRVPQRLVLVDGRTPYPVRLVRPAAERLSAMAQLGRDVFFDRTLSSSGALACASCHSPQHAYGPPNDVRVPAGGVRAVPSLMYLERQPNFSIGPDDMENEGAAPPSPSAGSALVPQGGLFWDGRTNTLQAQALQPLLNPREMAGVSVARVASKLRRAPYAARMVQLFGPAIFEQPGTAVAEALFAVARYQIEDVTFHPYSSKYDWWLEGKARLSRAEARGYALFRDPARANCAACHLDRPTPDGLPPLFTDHQFEALGVPRNAKLAANRVGSYYDLGLCGPVRTDMKHAAQYCGMFRTPTLRNVATRRAFFHNGIYATLEQVLDFYDFRDTRARRIYRTRRDGTIATYDDLPAADRGNVDTRDAPFDRKAGQTPALTTAEEHDIVAFLRTLTDGYRPSK
jgi:cytochrome c peroxidase